MGIHTHLPIKYDLTCVDHFFVLERASWLWVGSERTQCQRSPIEDPPSANCIHVYQLESMLSSGKELARGATLIDFAFP